MGCPNRRVYPHRRPPGVVRNLGYGLGDVVDTSMEYYFKCTVDCYDPYTDSFSDPDYAQRHNVRLKVVGVPRPGRRLPLLQRYPPSLKTSLQTTTQATGHHKHLLPEAPCERQALQEDSLELTDALLFTDTPERIDEYNALLADYGEVWSIERWRRPRTKCTRTQRRNTPCTRYWSRCCCSWAWGGYNTLMLERQKRTLGVYFSRGMP